MDREEMRFLAALEIYLHANRAMSGAIEQADKFLAELERTAPQGGWAQEQNRLLSRILCVLGVDEEEGEDAILWAAKGLREDALAHRAELERTAQPQEEPAATHPKREGALPRERAPMPVRGPGYVAAPAPAPEADEWRYFAGDPRVYRANEWRYEFRIGVEEPWRRGMLPGGLAAHFSPPPKGIREITREQAEAGMEQEPAAEEVKLTRRSDAERAAHFERRWAEANVQLESRCEQAEELQHLIDEVCVALGPYCTGGTIVDRVRKLKTALEAERAAHARTREAGERLAEFVARVTPTSGMEVHAAWRRALGVEPEPRDTAEGA